MICNFIERIDGKWLSETFFDDAWTINFFKAWKFHSLTWPYSPDILDLARFLRQETDIIFTVKAYDIIEKPITYYTAEVDTLIVWGDSVYKLEPGMGCHINRSIKKGWGYIGCKLIT